MREAPRNWRTAAVSDNPTVTSHPSPDRCTPTVSTRVAPRARRAALGDRAPVSSTSAAGTTTTRARKRWRSARRPVRYSCRPAQQCDAPDPHRPRTAGRLHASPPAAVATSGRSVRARRRPALPAPARRRRARRATATASAACRAPRQHGLPASRCRRAGRGRREARVRAPPSTHIDRPGLWRGASRDDRRRRWKVGPARIERLGLGLDDRVERLDHRRAAKRPLPRRHLVQHHAQRELVGTVVRRLAARLLGCHDSCRAEECADPCVGGGRAVSSVSASVPPGDPGEDSGFRSFANPKSRIFTNPSAVTITFSGLRSRCTILARAPWPCRRPAAWRYRRRAGAAGVPRAAPRAACAPR